MKMVYWFIGIIIIVLTFYILFLILGITTICCPPTKFETAKNQACQSLHSIGCKDSSNSIILKDFDANRDEKINSGDTLFELCKNYYDAETDSDCKAICGCT